MDASAGEPPRSTPGEAAAGVSAQASKDAGRRAALFEGAAAAGFRGVVAAGLQVRGVAMRSVRVGLAAGLFEASRSGASRGTKRLRRTARLAQAVANGPCQWPRRMPTHTAAAERSSSAAQVRLTSPLLRV